MKLKECYDTIGGNYEDVRQRIPSDKIITKFVIKFLSDPSYRNLSASLERENYEEAFRAAHSLKGVSQNLGFQRLGSSSSALTEVLRERGERKLTPDLWKELFGQVSADYEAVTEAVGKLKEAQELSFKRTACNLI